MGGAAKVYEGAAAAAGTVAFTAHDARPPRENAFGQRLTDGPYQTLDVGAYTRLSIATTDEANLTVEVRQGEDWAELATFEGPGAFQLTDLAYTQMRVTTDAAAVVSLVLGC